MRSDPQTRHNVQSTKIKTKTEKDVGSNELESSNILFFAWFFSNFMTYDSGCPKPTESIQQEIAHKGSSKTKYNCDSKTTSLNTLAIQSVSSTKIQFKIKLIQTSKPIYHCGGMDGVMVPSSQEQQMLPSCMKPQNRCLSEAASF